MVLSPLVLKETVTQEHNQDPSSGLSSCFCQFLWRLSVNFPSSDPLKVMIFDAPVSGKGIQCQLISKSGKRVWGELG